MELNYIWNENYPIAIHVNDKEASPQSLQLLANMEDLPVRHIPTNKSFYPQSSEPVMSLQNDLYMIFDKDN